MKRNICFLLFGTIFLGFVVISVRASNVEKKFEVRRSRYNSDRRFSSGAYPDLGPLFQSAQTDTYCLVYYDFELENWQGWTRVDNTAQPDTFFHVDDFAGLGGGDFGRLIPIIGSKSMWCGARSDPGHPYVCSWVTPPGYGNDWEQMFVSDTIYAYPYELYFEYYISYDCEDECDFVYVEYEESDGSWAEIARYDSIGTQHASHYLDSLDHTRLRFRFVSDAWYSDEDGSYNSDGAVIIDNIFVEKIFGSNVDSEDFEGASVGDKHVDGDGNGFYWHADVKEPFGKYSGLRKNLIDKDPCNENHSTQIVFFIGSSQWSMEYPGLEETPYCKGSGTGEPPCQNEMAVSPIIDLTKYSTNCNENQNASIPGDLSGMGGVELNFTVYADLPLENCVYYIWKVRNISSDGCPGYWLDRFHVYPGDDREYVFESFAIGDLVTEDSIQVAVGVVDMCDVWYGVYCDCVAHTPSPWIDNVKVQRYRNAGPQWSYRDYNLFQDNFPSQEYDLESYIRSDMAMDLNPLDNPTIRPGDSIVVTCTSPAGCGIAEDAYGPRVYMHAKCEYIGPMVPPWGPKPNLVGPSLEGNYGRYSSDDGTWTIIQAEQARLGGYPIPDRYMFDLNDSLFTRGYMISYYFSAYDNDGERSTLPPNAEVLAALTYGSETTTYKGVSYVFEFTCLPTLDSDILYVDDFDGCGTFWGEAEQYWNPSFLAVIPSYNWPDRYDVRAPALEASNGPGRCAKQYHLKNAYGTIIWDSGNLSHCTISDGTDYSDKSGDLQMLRDWVRFSEFDDVCLWVLGDDVALDLDGAAAAAAAHELMTEYCGVVHANDSYYDLSGGWAGGGVITPKVSAVPGVGNPLWHITWGDSLYAFGGCPKINRLDVLEKAFSGQYALSYPDYMGAPYYAGIYSLRINDYGNVVRTMWFGFSMAYMRECVDTEPMMRNQIVKDVLAWMENPSNPDITEVDEVPAVYSLSQNFPNPFNPTTTIKFGLRAKGHASLKIYDVTGRLVKTLVDEVLDAGRHEAIWNGRNNLGKEVASGIYFYRLQAGSFERTKKMVLLR